MAVCMVFTLLPMNNMRAMADESWMKDCRQMKPEQKDIMKVVMKQKPQADRPLP